MAKRKAEDVKINWQDVFDMCFVQATQDEIAAVLDISNDTLDRRCRSELGMSFAVLYAKKRKKGFVSLRRKQFELAIKGDRTLLIWLGKQYLGQSEQIEESSVKKQIIKLSYSLDKDDDE